MESLTDQSKTTLSLAGRWELALEKANGMIQNPAQWAHLPGTLDENGKGVLDEENRLNQLSRKYVYTGQAVYQKKFVLSSGWKEKQVKLFLERTRVTRVWVNNQFAGSNHGLTTPHVYNITAFLCEGENVVTVEVDNSYENLPTKGIMESHMATGHTQTNWNGILGRMELQFKKNLHIERVSAYPDIHNCKARVIIDIYNALSEEINGNFTLRAESWNGPCVHKTAQQEYPFVAAHGFQRMEVEYDFGEKVRLWDEFTPVLYKLHVEMKSAAQHDCMAIDFGMREFKCNEERTQFSVNGKNTFLRSEANCAVFPLTGYAPMDEKSWEEIFSTYQSFGINHVRFHSWCPPEAAFRVADRKGIFMQPELSQWAFDTFEKDSDYSYYTCEAESVVREYANHPSFVQYTWGNELAGDRQRMGELCVHMRAMDPTRLYAEGSNTWYGKKGPNPQSDFYTAQAWEDHGSLRGSFSGVRGYINNEPSSTVHEYAREIMSAGMPVYSFEVGQYQVSPDFDEIDQYTGVLEARNLKVFRKRLEEKGMLELAPEFHSASGKFSRICYREEIEAALRTPKMAGISLLGIQDFPGQGTALVGMVNALGRTKNFADPAGFRKFSGPVVPLLCMEKYIWTNSEAYTAVLKIANYGSQNISARPYWLVKNISGEILKSGELSTQEAQQGKLTELGRINLALSFVTEACKLIMEVGCKDTEYVNQYDLWVYKESIDTRPPEEVLIRRNFDRDVEDALAQGKKVLLLPEPTEASMPGSIPGVYIPDFWCYPMFKNAGSGQPGTLGLFIKNRHPALAAFPTEEHSNWQWWHLVKNARALVLDNTPSGYRPIIQPIDNFERNHKLGLLLEARLSAGKLMICSVDLPKLQDQPEARQLLYSILRYMGSEDFAPQQELEIDFIKSILNELSF